MIKIELQEKTKILDFHYNNINYKKGREMTVVDFLNNRIKKNLLFIDLVGMYNFLIENIKKDSSGFSIIIASPFELENFKKLFEARYGLLLDTTYKITTSGKIITYRNDLLKIFYYEEYDKWKAYDLAKKIGVNVCPYCNRMYTFVLGNDFNKGTRFEYDHFFNKSNYPYLALSFYNLIPSCHVCNSNFKGKKEFNLNKNIHPYVEGFNNDIVFSIKPKNISFINGRHSAYRIKFKKGNLSLWNNIKVEAAFENISTFQLTKLYNMHKDYVDEIIQKSIIYNQDYISSLYKTFEGTLFKNEDDVKRLVLGNYIDEKSYSKRPLSKLTADISKELGLI
ncbi:MAG: hypothetical protein ABI554_11420 [Flavobacterium sp.]